MQLCSASMKAWSVSLMKDNRRPGSFSTSFSVSVLWGEPWRREMHLWKSKTSVEEVRGDIYSNYGGSEALVQMMFCCTGTPSVKLMVVCQWLLRTWHAKHEAFIYVSNTLTSGKVIHQIYVEIYFLPPLHIPVNRTRGRTLSPNNDEKQLQHSTHWRKLLYLSGVSLTRDTQEHLYFIQCNVL